MLSSIQSIFAKWMVLAFTMMGLSHGWAVTGILGTVYGIDRLREEDMFVDHIEILLARNNRPQKAEQFHILSP